MARRYLLNDDPVEECVEALVATSGGELARLDGFEKGVRVVVRAGYEELKSQGRVAVVCGGGSGHEPGYCGMVGEGLLTAAVAGDVFASPTERSVFETIRTVTGDAGCLVVVMNYMGDRLHFGLAVTRARQLGLPVNMVIVSDDIGIPGLPREKSRGIAGATLVLKQACCAAENQATLDEVTAVARQAAAGVRSIGVSTTECTPIRPVESPEPPRFTPAEMEVGLGIHGEPGSRVLPFEQPAALCARLVKQLAAGSEVAAEAGHALLVNNLGTCTVMEMLHISKSALSACSAAGIDVAVLVTGAMVTSLDMRGFSLSLMPLQSDVELGRLTAPTTAPGWGRVTRLQGPAAKPVQLQPEISAPPADERDTCAPGEGGVALRGLLERGLEAACRALAGAEAELNDLDRRVGDGDCGTTLANGASRVLRDMAGYPRAPHEFIRGVARSLEQSMGGTTGGLYAIALEAAANALQKAQSCAWQALAASFAAGVSAVTEYGGAEEGGRTMQDALIPAAKALQ
eukprot:gene23024-35277_t